MFITITPALLIMTSLLVCINVVHLQNSNANVHIHLQSAHIPRMTPFQARHRSLNALLCSNPLAVASTLVSVPLGSTNAAAVFSPTHGAADIKPDDMFITSTISLCQSRQRQVPFWTCPIWKPSSGTCVTLSGHIRLLTYSAQV